MSTSSLRLDDSLRARIAQVARATEQTPHSFMVQALAEKVDEAEWKLAVQQEAHRRDQALVAGEPGVEWHEMKSWLQQRLDTGNKKSSAPKRRK